MNLYRDLLKRLFDIVMSAASIVVLSPLLLLTGVAIRVEDGGPALFRQKRVGRRGEPFLLYKFRSMPVNTGDIAKADATAVRITRVGRLIRRTNIDELPQLFNILRGEMSLVGPRPALPSQSILLAERARLGAMQCKPGLTGLAQIRAYDGMPEAEKARFDCEYARSISLVGDLGIVLRTFGYLRRRPPVY